MQLPPLDLGLGKPPAETRVVVAMSGGVDSAVTAALVHAAGYDTVGITLQLYDHGAAVGRRKACCAGQDIQDARNAAARIGIPHYVLDYESRFREAVMQDFADSYARGETPIPCVRCNQTVKFTDLLRTAQELGAEALATGHYVRRVDGPAGPELHRAVDPARDQSYFLFATTAEQLSLLRFPLGGLPKAETRRIAAALDLGLAEKPDSQDICFVPTGNYAQVVQRLRPEAGEPGEIVDLSGQVLGRHEGIIHYTVGQRRGLGLGARSDETEPLYVVRLDAAARRVVVGPRAALGKPGVRISEVNWLGAPAAGPIPVQVKLRSAMAPVAATLELDGEGKGLVMFDALQFGVAPGQACVVYDGERMLGGGWIAAQPVPAATEALAAQEPMTPPSSLVMTTVADRG